MQKNIAQTRVHQRRLIAFTQDKIHRKARRANQNVTSLTRVKGCNWSSRAVAKFHFDQIVDKWLAYFEQVT